MPSPSRRRIWCTALITSNTTQVEFEKNFARAKQKLPGQNPKTEFWKIENRNFPNSIFPKPERSFFPMPMTEPRFRNLCSFWTRLSHTPRCVALNDYYEPQYSMWSRCNIVIPLMNWECIAFFRPRTFSKDQLEELNFLRTGRPDADLSLSRFVREYSNFPHTKCVTSTATLKSYIKTPNSTDTLFSGFPAIPIQRPEQYGYSRPLLNLLVPIIEPRSANPIEFGTFDVENSLHTILYVRSRFNGSTFWLNDKPSAPRKEHTK